MLNTQRQDLLKKLETSYQTLLSNYLQEQSEIYLHAAYQLGRQYLGKNCSILDIIAVHHNCLVSILEQTEKEQLLKTSELANVFLEEILATFEMTDSKLIETLALLNKRTLDFANRTHKLKIEINERKLAEEALSKLNTELEARVLARTAELETANKELESFSYSVSHDLRAPLRHISGFIELLLNDKDLKQKMSEKNLHHFNIIVESAKKMSLLIDDLLEFSRVGRYELRKYNVNLNLIIDEVLTELSSQVKNRDIHWDISKNMIVCADREMLRLVITNLLSNALKYTRPVKQVQIEIKIEKQDPTETIFYVRDNGVGFNMNYIDKIFGVFQRLHTQSEFEGTGIGLANVHRIVKRHGGRVWAMATVGKGATFYIALPNLKENME